MNIKFYTKKGSRHRYYGVCELPKQRRTILLKDIDFKDKPYCVDFPELRFEISFHAGICRLEPTTNFIYTNLAVTTLERYVLFMPNISSIGDVCLRMPLAAMCPKQLCSNAIDAFWACPFDDTGYSRQERTVFHMCLQHQKVFRRKLNDNIKCRRLPVSGNEISLEDLLKI